MEREKIIEVLNKYFPTTIDTFEDSCKYCHGTGAYNNGSHMDMLCVFCRKTITLEQIATELSEVKEDDFPDIDFRRDIAEELSRGELIDRLCEMNDSYQSMRKEWFDKCHVNAGKNVTNLRQQTSECADNLKGKEPIRDQYGYPLAGANNHIEFEVKEPIDLLNPEKLRKVLNKYCGSLGHSIYAVSRSDFEKVISEATCHNEQVETKESPANEVKEPAQITDEQIINFAFKEAYNYHTKEWEDGYIEGAKAYRDGQIAEWVKNKK